MSFSDLLDAGRASMRSPSPLVAESLAALVDLIDWGLCTCDADGEVSHANRAANREFASGAVLTVVGGVVRSLGASQVELIGAVRDAARLQKNRMLLMGDACNRLAVVISPIVVAGAPESLVLLMLGRRSLCSPLALEMLASRHDLTHMERRVLCGLLTNQSPRQIASTHRVSLPTIRTQIQSLREKMGVHSVDELLLFAASIPPVGARVTSLMQSMNSERLPMRMAP